MSLSISDYNTLESKGVINLSNRFIRAFKAKVFENGGFPTRINYDEELYRYIDSMHANSFENYYHNLCGGITKEEFELLKKTTKDIYDYTKKNCGKKFLVKAPMISSICEKRLINSALNSDGSNTVFEIGGGSGTLGCVLLEDNHRYVATDVTQSFYILQSRMYEYISKNDICELVTDPLNTKSQCIHIPYWKLWELRYEQIPIDIVVSNHALLEMSQNSLRFYLNWMRKSLEKSKTGAFVFQGGGWRVEQNLIDLIELFENYGYHLKYFDHAKEIAAFDLREGSVAPQVLDALRNLLKSDKLESEKIYALGNHLLTRLDKKDIFYTGDLGNRIKDNFDYIDKEEKVDIKEVLKFYNKFEITSDSPDDEFAEYIKEQ